MIRQFNLTLAANETREVALSGIYFQIFQMLQSMTLIEILDKSGGVISLIDSPLESMFIRATERYQTLRFSNGPTAQTVKFFYGDGDAGSNRFSGNITGTVGLDAATLAALESVDLNAATQNTLRYPLTPTNYFVDRAALAINTALLVFSAASNANGAIILAAKMWFQQSAALADGALICGAAAPASVAGNVLLLTNPLYGGAAVGSGGYLQQPVFVPAGFGLWFIQSQGSNAAEGARFANYKLL